MSRLNKKGFTLIELLIVVALIAVMASIGLPSLMSQMAHLRTKRAALDISVELNAARLKAIAANTRYKVAFTQGNPDSYILQFWNAAANAWANDPTRSQRSLSTDADIYSPAADFEVIFFPGGSATDQANTTANQVICIRNVQNATDIFSIGISAAIGKVTVGAAGC